MTRRTRPQTLPRIRIPTTEEADEILQNPNTRPLVHDILALAATADPVDAAADVLLAAAIQFRRTAVALAPLL